MHLRKNKLSKFKFIFILSATLLSLMMLTLPATTFADCHTSATPGKIEVTKDKDGKVIKRTPKEGDIAKGDELQKCLKDNPIVKRLRQIVDFLSAGVGIVIVGSVIIGGIQYAAGGNNPNTISAAKKRITDALIALLAFIFMYAFLQWLIPGKSFFNL